MKCSCIKGNYNVWVDVIDRKTLLYQDISDWMDESRYDLPENYFVKITPPGKDSGGLLKLNVSGINKLTEKEIGPLEDGIWCFQTDSCGVNYKRSVGIYYKIECCLKKAFATTDKYDQLKEVEKYLDLTKAAVSINNFSQAEEYLEITQDKLERIKCDCNC